MNDAKRKFLLTLIVIFLGGTSACTQKSQPYPANADDVAATVETLSRIDFSIADAVKRFGDIATDDDGKQWFINLTPFASEQKRIKSVRLDTYDARRKLDSATIEYTEPVSISYGKLRQKYGEPIPLPLPTVTCVPDKPDCLRPAFIGYAFEFTPAAGDANKRVGMLINLEMQWSRTIPNHSDRDFLAVKSIRFKRIIED